MGKVKYVFPKSEGIEFHGRGERLTIPMEVVKKALHDSNATILTLQESADSLFEILGMRNLSAFIGELFVRSLAKASAGLLVKNPHQDGYPDLLVMTPEGKALLKTLEQNMQAKAPFSSFETGGIEIKATCGSVPTPAVCTKRGCKKPGIGDTRIEMLLGYDWKAHHRLTNHLIGIVWDFIDGAPIIVGLFYSLDLGESDWGVIVQPKEGGGRTTSVSIMNDKGISKMYEGWLAVIDDERYIGFFDAFNAGTLLADAKEVGAVGS